jgi:hypothetical protein
MYGFATPGTGCEGAWSLKVVCFSVMLKCGGDVVRAEVGFKWEHINMVFKLPLSYKKREGKEFREF